MITVGIRMSATRVQKQYLCPGENYPISHSVHLSRIAAFYPKCRNCPLRNETGHLPSHVVEQFRETERRVSRDSFLTPEGVRGIVPNELNRHLAGQWATAFAGELWKAFPRRSNGRKAASKDEGHSRTHTVPTILLGQDERATSLELAIGVAAGLRLSGALVLDLGVVTKSEFVLAVQLLRASGGVFVTGSGKNLSWNGLDFVGSGGMPISSATSVADQLTLTDLESVISQPSGRPSRQAVPQETFAIRRQYLESLQPTFHAVRPLRICWASSSRLIAEQVETLFGSLSCKLFRVEIPQRERLLNDPEDPDLQKVSTAVRVNQAHLGILLHEDSQQCSLLDEQGRLIDVRLLFALLAAAETETVVQQGEAWAEPLTLNAGWSMMTTYLEMNARQASCAGGVDNRFWFRQPEPVADALLTLGKLLQVLSQSDVAFSRLLHQLQNTRNKQQ